MMTDPIADLLTRIRNAHHAEKISLTMPGSKVKAAIAQVLKDEGFIENFSETGEGIRKHLVISLKYKGRNRKPIIQKLQRVSKPGLRVYSNHQDLPRVLGGIGIAIISTSKGVMTNLKAKELGIGGEVLCYIW